GKIQVTVRRRETCCEVVTRNSGDRFISQPTADSRLPKSSCNRERLDRTTPAVFHYSPNSLEESVMKTLSSEELKEMRNRQEPFPLINVLPAGKFRETRIPGAESIPLEDPHFAMRVEEAVGDKDKAVVTYCASEQCPASTQAAQELEAAGFS